MVPLEISIIYIKSYDKKSGTIGKKIVVPVPRIVVPLYRKGEKRYQFLVSAQLFSGSRKVK